MKKLHPETVVISKEYNPADHLQSIKPPIYQSSNYLFATAEEGKRIMGTAFGIIEPEPGIDPGLHYSRVHNPNLEVLEKRLVAWDGAETSAAFESGMAAIATVLLTLLRPGDIILCGGQLYGGTDSFIKNILTEFKVGFLEFDTDLEFDELNAFIDRSGLREKIAVVYAETPANPTNKLTDLEMVARLAKSLSTPEKKVISIADNTFMGPLWQHPIKHGIDLVIYSATKYMAGHSDLLVGAVLGSKAQIQPIKRMRTMLGCAASPHTAWMLTRSLETVKIRMEQQGRNAERLAAFLDQHPAVEKVYYPGIQRKTDARAERIMSRQCKANGAMISIDIKGGEKEAFAFLNKLQLFKLGVSLGSTESLAQHPNTMTNAKVSAADRKRMNITEKLIRLSIGIENVEDLEADLEQALHV
jgi:methionine-gamma-lyase